MRNHKITLNARRYANLSEAVILVQRVRLWFIIREVRKQNNRSQLKYIENQVLEQRKGSGKQKCKYLELEHGVHVICIQDQAKHSRLFHSREILSKISLHLAEIPAWQPAKI